MIGSWTLVTPPTDEPVTLTEIKDHLHVSSTAEDSLLALYAQMAREAVEAETWRALMPQTWSLYLDAWPADGIIELPRPPLQSVTSITYTDEDGVTQTLAASNYRVDIAREPGRVVLAPDGEWPSDALDTSNPIAVTFCGGLRGRQRGAGDSKGGDFVGVSVDLCCPRIYCCRREAADGGAGCAAGDQSGCKCAGRWRHAARP